jgi:hypothetical protein
LDNISKNECKVKQISFAKEELILISLNFSEKTCSPWRWASQAFPVDKDFL